MKYEIAISKVEALLSKAKEAEVRGGVAGLPNSIKVEVAGFYNALAWHIVSTKSTPAADVRKAKSAASRACELTDYNDAQFIDTLASIEAAEGDYGSALELEERALGLLDESANDRAEFRSKIERWGRQAKEDRPNY